MPALNFMAQFAPLVESGEKRQTIRAYRKDDRDPKRGDALYLYTGMRQKGKCRLLREVQSESVEPIRIERHHPRAVEPCVVVGENDEWQPGDFDDPFAIEKKFAKNDGFNSWREMWEWFEKTHGLPFEGLLIRW